MDGIFISGQKLACDEASATEASGLAHKTPGDQVFIALWTGLKKDWEKLDPFIISGSKVVEGYRTFLVTGSWHQLHLHQDRHRSENISRYDETSEGILRGWLVDFGCGIYI